MKLNRKQLEEIREKIEAGYIVKRNVREQGKDIAVGLYFPVFSDEGIKAGWLALGLTRPTYQENKEEIEKVIAEAMEKRREKEAEETRKKRENLKVVEVAYDWETGRRLYALSSQVSKEEWRKIAPYMAHYSTRGEVDAEWDNQYEGWVVKTGCIEKVEDILNIKPELRLEERRRRAEEELRKEKEARKELKKKIEEIKTAIKAYKAGALKEDAKVFSAVKTIFSEQKINPNEKKKNEKGEYPVTVFQIDYNPNMRYCWTVYMENGWGEIDKRENGGIFIKKGSYRKEKETKVVVDDETFREMVRQVNDYIFQKELLFMSQLQKQLAEYEEKKRQEAANK